MAGKFSIKRATIGIHSSDELSIDGIVQFVWLPNPGSTFTGFTKALSGAIAKINRSQEPWQLIIEGMSIGRVYITSFSISSNHSNTPIKGILTGEVVRGDKCIEVKKIKFCVPNFKGFTGLSVKRITPTNQSFHKNRIILDNDKYLIQIDKCYNYEDLNNSLNAAGGYIIQYAGELTMKKDPVSHNTVIPIIRFHYYVSNCIRAFI